MKKKTHFSLGLRGIIICLSLIFLVVLAGCSSTEGDAEADPIQNIEWQWVSVTVKSTGEVTTVPNPEVYTIVFIQMGQ